MLGLVDIFIVFYFINFFSKFQDLFSFSNCSVFSDQFCDHMKQTVSLREPVSQAKTCVIYGMDITEPLGMT